MPNPHSRIPTVATTHHPRKIIALGDSFVYGFGDTEGGGWADRLRRYWMQSGASGDILYNLGVRGDGISQLSQRWEAEYRCRGELRNRLPDGCVISIGANDSARLGHRNGRHFTAGDRFESQLAGLLDGALELGKVWFVGMVPVDEAKMPFAGAFYYSLDDQRRYNALARRLCGEREIPFLDSFERWLDKGDLWRLARLSEDGLHPNSEGYRAVFEDLLACPAMVDLTGVDRDDRVDAVELAIV